MTNIVNFPTKPVRDWVVIERSMRKELSRLGFPENVQERITERMQDFYTLLDVDFNYSIDAKFPRLTPEEVSSICSDIAAKVGTIQSKKLQAFTDKLFTERLHREIDSCREVGML
jgi:hypothetical protein